MENSLNSHPGVKEHTTSQIIIFVFCFVFFVCLIFYSFLPFIQSVIVHSLGGSVFNDGTLINVVKDLKKEVCKSHYLFKWAMDIGKPDPTRYWLNPVLSLMIPSALIGLLISIFVSALLPIKYSLIGQKIEREIDNFLYKINSKTNIHMSEVDNINLCNEIKDANLTHLHKLCEDWGISNDDLKSLRNALLWRESRNINKLIYAGAGVSFYLRFHFTEKYDNMVMGLVYIGAAVLIIIIGMRGLKFIPPTEPSLVFFALGLEFSLLITYAFTLMFSKQDTDVPIESKNTTYDSMLFSNEYGSSKEVENLLKVFIKSTKNKN